MKTLIYAILLSFSFSLLPQKTIAQTDDFEVGFIMASLFVDRWSKEKDFFEARINELGGTMTFIDCYDQVSNQIAAAEKLIAEKVDAIVVVAIDAVASAPVVELAKKAGIPIIAYDRLILNVPLDYYISFNSVAVGELMAKEVVSKLPKGNILYVGGPSDDHNSALIRKGVFNILNTVSDKYSIQATSVSSWTELDAYLSVQDYIENKGSQPDAIICAADILTRGAINVLLENNTLGEVLLTGQDAELDICKAILNNEVAISIYKPGKKLAETTADLVWKILEEKNLDISQTTNNGLIDVPSILLDPIPVTKETLEETVVKDGYYTHEAVFGTKK